MRVNCFVAARPGNAGGRAEASRKEALGASQIRDFYTLSDGSQSSI